MRKQRGQEIAKQGQLFCTGPWWIVPSQTGEARYKVEMTDGAPRCDCPDFTLRGMKCKHIFAVEFTVSREVSQTAEIDSEGNTTLTMAVTETKTARVTYKQDWTTYNRAQTHEGEHFPELLNGLCAGITQPAQTKGRPRLLLSDATFAAVMKVYSTVSGRRAMSDIQSCVDRGYLTKKPCYNSIFGYLDNPALTPILKSLIEESAAPLRAVETDFAVDASGFTTSRFVRWYDAKYGKMRSEHEWVKCHLMIGVKTNVVTSVEVTPGASNDSPHLPALVNATAERFDLAEVSADKGYISKANLDAIVATGAVPYIPFKVNTTGEGPALWRQMFHYYSFNRADFLAHYHKRSNVETTFSMIKRKFGDSLRSKSPTAQVNELLCKVLAHNICVLIHSIYELGIQPAFWAESAVAQEMAS